MVSSGACCRNALHTGLVCRWWMVMQIIRFPGSGRRRARAGEAEQPGELVPLEKRRGPRAVKPEERSAGILPLVVDDVHYIVNRTALLRGVSFRLPAGRRTVLLGYNGAGKSLLLRLCHGLLAPTSGQVRWEGALGGQALHVARAQAMVFQRPVLLRRSVRENLLFALRARGGGRGRAIMQRVDEALALAGVEHLAERPARALSGGEQQKLALARAWLLQPEVLFLDEPTASLDPAATLELEALMMRLHEGGCTLLFSTHDMAQARRLAQHVLFMHNGLLLEDAPAEAFFQRPETPEARAFLAGELMP